MVYYSQAWGQELWPLILEHTLNIFLGICPTPSHIPHNCIANVGVSVSSLSQGSSSLLAAYHIAWYLNTTLNTIAGGGGERRE